MAHKDRRRATGRGGIAALIAVGIFGALATMPLTLRALNLHILPVAAKSTYGVSLLPAPSQPAGVALPAVARPIGPGQPPASIPAVNPTREAAVVSAEDNRIRIMLHHAIRIYQPVVLPVRGSLPTLVLTAGPRPYTAADLIQYGALVMLPGKAGLLLDSVFVSTNAKLVLGSPDLRVLYLDNTSGGFTSIVAWGGSLAFRGTPVHPLTIMGWDRVSNAPASDRGDGRSYIREVAGHMTLDNVRVSALGFWSGRTGGVAWTGVNRTPSTGSASDSTFTNDTYGAFIARSQSVTLTSDLFEFNQLDGVHIHRYSVGTIVTSSSSSRNGGNGFLVDRATQGTILTQNVSQHNTLNGYLIDGRPLVNGASASGSSVAPGTGTVVDGSAALDNGRTGILVEGGTGTVLRSDQVCGKITAIAVRYGATDTVITGNDIRCDPRSGLSVGPVAPGTVVSGNTVVDPRIGILIRNSGPVTADNNVIAGATVFGISARGLASRVRGVGNVISGTGFRAIDARADAGAPAMYGTNATGWVHHVRVTFWSYLRFHPLAALWLSIAVLVMLCFFWTRRRRLPAHPYAASTRWSLVPVTQAGGMGSHQPRIQPELVAAEESAWVPVPAATVRPSYEMHHSTVDLGHESQFAAHLHRVEAAAPPWPAADPALAQVRSSPPWEHQDRAAAAARSVWEPALAASVLPWGAMDGDPTWDPPARHSSARPGDEAAASTRPIPRVTER